MPTKKPTTVSEYLKNLPEPAQEKLREMHTILKEVAPKATEALKWGNPVFEENRILFAYAAFKNHYSFMPTPSALEPFKDEIKNYKVGKGSVQFLYSDPLPKALIKKIAKYRAKDVRENDARWM